MAQFALLIGVAERPVPQHMRDRLTALLSQVPGTACTDRQFGPAGFYVQTCVDGARVFHDLQAASRTGAMIGLADRHFKDVAGNWAGRIDEAMAALPPVSALWTYDTEQRQLHLAADPSGTRPLYYYQDQKFILVTSALWIMEACDWIPKVAAEEALHERIALGYSLDGRTPYQGIDRVMGGQRVTLSPDTGRAAVRSRWHDWLAAAAPRIEAKTMLELLHQTFMAAVDRLIPMQHGAVAALSGGLDTRVVVASLLALGHAPHCLTFTWRNSLDGAIARAFAQAAQLRQTIMDVPRPLDEPFLVKTGRALKTLLDQSYATIWTGYGGSIGAGYVHSTPEIVQLARAGSFRQVAERLLAAKGVAFPRTLFGAQRAAQLQNRLAEKLASELEAVEGPDRGRCVQIYLLNNQEPEQLRPLMENTDLLGFDVLAPFYDPQVLNAWLGVPLEDALLHRAYVNWLSLLPQVTTQVAWQAYPGHVRSSAPLPVAIETDQWSDHDAAYAAQQARNDQHFVARSARAGVRRSVHAPQWRQFGIDFAGHLGKRDVAYLGRMARQLASFEQGIGAIINDRLETSVTAPVYG